MTNVSATYGLQLLAANPRLNTEIKHFDKETAENVKKDKDEVSVQDFDIKVN